MNKTILKCTSIGTQNVKNAVISQHITEERRKRIEALSIASKKHGRNPFKIVAAFYEEDNFRSLYAGYCSDTITVISATGTIYKFSVGRNPKMITFYFSGPNKIKRYFDAIGEKAPEDLLEIARKNQKMGLHKI